MNLSCYSRAQVGDILQISPLVKSSYGGCLMIMTNKTGKHAEGFVATPEGPLLIKAKWENVAWVGMTKWYPENNLNDFKHDFTGVKQYEL